VVRLRLVPNELEDVLCMRARRLPNMPPEDATSPLLLLSMVLLLLLLSMLLLLLSMLLLLSTMLLLLSMMPLVSVVGAASEAKWRPCC
jgi:hypothetical protein